MPDEQVVDFTEEEYQDALEAYEKFLEENKQINDLPEKQINDL